MPTNALTRTLQIAYPVAIFLATLASAGMNLIQAGSPDFNPLFPSHGNHRIDRTLASPGRKLEQNESTTHNHKGGTYENATHSHHADAEKCRRQTV